ncbi:NAD(P)-binding protein [Parathielavia hyrcaniae]|uniref:NAD(P)-binding protein n=1 Tax=Parathielavia hyrcaniae TaxID=113614 RepID=A0AAN6SZI5_9PEZI|nr:NAD(P)-binding protein [Parathielavia hyrcaniae]
MTSSASRLTTTTKAWIFHRPGPYRQTLTLTNTHPLPPFPPTAPFPKTAPNPEEWLLLRVSYAALNPADLVTVSVMPFFIRSHRKTSPAAVPCFDFTADVVDVWHPDSNDTTTTGVGKKGAAATRFAKGDQVVCFPPMPHMLATGVGALQGVVALPARYAVRIPAGRTKREAAGLFMTACTADVQIEDCGIAAGQRVLVVGASGGIGTMAVQMVRDRVGADGRVVAVCSGRNVEMVRGLGADEVIDYTQYADLPGELTKRYGAQPFDHIIDCFGNQDVYKSSARYLKAEGMYNAASISYADYTFWELLKCGMTLLTNSIWPRSQWLGGTGRKFKSASMMDPGVDTMERLVKLLGDGKLRIVVDSEWPFEKVHDAFDVLKTGHAAGKVIVKVNEE